MCRTETGWRPGPRGGCTAESAFHRGGSKARARGHASRGSRKSEQPGASGSTSKGMESQEAIPFVLSEALPVVPGKLVKKILRGEFVDMLKDNVEAERRRLAPGENSQIPRPSRREIPDFESWLQCFSSYAAVVGSKYPHKCKELWAYQAFMIAEHRKCGGRGWLLYDNAFRQQIPSLEAADFSRINQGLYSTTFLAYGGKGQFCTRCMMSDHSREECALHPNRAVPMVQFREPSRREEVADPRRKRGRRGACYAFNDGKCSSQYCKYDHVCSHCGGEHKKAACRARGARGREREIPPGPKPLS